MIIIKTPKKRPHKTVWAVQGAAVRQFATMSEAARAFGMEPCTFINLRAAAHNEGNPYFYAAGVKFLLDAPVEQSSTARSPEGPLLEGHCTHRLGVYLGGDV